MRHMYTTHVYLLLYPNRCGFPQDAKAAQSAVAEALSLCLGSGGGGGSGGDGTRVGMNRTEDSFGKRVIYVCIYVYIYIACLAGSKEFGVCFFGYFNRLAPVSRRPGPHASQQVV